MATQTGSETSGKSPLGQREPVLPLELLLVSDDTSYGKGGKEVYTALTTPEGRTLFNVATANKKELSDVVSWETGSGANHQPDILLFDLRGDLNAGLSLLDNYLSRHLKCFAIASVEDSHMDELLHHPLWQALQQREGKGITLTQIYRFPHKGDPKQYFTWVYEDTLKAALPTISGLKSGSLAIIIRHPLHPTEFGDFSKEIRAQAPSDLVRRSLNTIAELNPDLILEALIKIQPTNYRHSVPQHCYPPFEELVALSQDQLLPIIQGQNGNLSLYVHIPFCPGKDPCTFCDYWTLRGNKEVQRYLELLRKEMQIYHDKAGWQAISPQGIHIGGGTPSMLSPELIRELGKFLKEFFPDYQKTAQLTFEVSPSTTTSEKLDAFKELGASRASIGLQSTNESLLYMLRRWFTTDAGRKSVKMLLEYWPKTTNVDLMYGLPGQTIDSWERDLDTVLRLGMPSITAYELRESPRTRFPEEQTYPRLYERMLMHVMATERLIREGFNQVSDNQFVRSVEGQPYAYRDSKKRGGNTLGIGGSSYSIFPGIVFFNIGGRDPHDLSNLEKYASAVASGILPVEIGKILDSREQMSLFMIQGLKLSGVGKAANGVNMAQFEKRFGQPIYSGFPVAAMLQSLGLLEEKGGYLGLTSKGLAFETLALKAFYQRH